VVVAAGAAGIAVKLPGGLEECLDLLGAVEPDLGSAIAFRRLRRPFAGLRDQFVLECDLEDLGEA
jgi:hypothetical protein